MEYSGRPFFIWGYNMTFKEFLETRAKRLQLGAYGEAELRSLINDAISKIELGLFKHYGEMYYPTGLRANTCLMNLSNEVSMVKDVFVYDAGQNTIQRTLAVYYDLAEFIRDNPTMGVPGQPTAVLVMPNTLLQQSTFANTVLAPFEEFTADMFGGNTRMLLLFNSKPAEDLMLRLVVKRGFARIYRDTDTNLLLTDWSDVLLASLRCVVAEDRNNWNDLKVLESRLQEKLFILNRVAAQKDNEAIGALNASS